VVWLKPLICSNSTTLMASGSLSLPLPSFLLSLAFWGFGSGGPVGSPWRSDVRVGNISQEWIINIEIPIFKNGQPFRALAVALKTQSFLRLLNAQHIPENWLACITRELIVTANAHSALSGWPVAIAVKKAAMQAVAWNTIRWAAIAAGSLSVLSLLFAGLISRRITGPIAALRQNAGALLAGPTLSKRPEGPPEVSDLWKALKQSAEGRDRSEQALRESEERLRLANEAAGIGTFTVDMEVACADYSPELAAMVGVPGIRTVRIEDAFARVHRDDVASARAKFGAGLTWPGESQIKGDFRFVRPGGEIRWMSWTGRVDFRGGPSGRVPFRIVGACVDITERKQAEAALRESEERFRGIFENAATGIAITDINGQYQCCNPAYTSLLGFSEQELREINCTTLIHPDDLEANLAEKRRLFAGAISSFEIVNRYVGKDGRPVWVHKHVSLLCDAAGRPTNTIALVTDISERKRQEDHIRLLMHEVNHRSKNLLTVVQSIARQTASVRPADFLERFDMRIAALAASQDLLVKNEWKGVDLEALVRSQLAHFEDLVGTRITLRGPPLSISASAAQAIGMALHELATNAGKHGALADGAGLVAIDWGIKRTSASVETFEMNWREFCAQSIATPLDRGFGSTVICQMVEMRLDAKVDLQFPSAGLSWQLQCPAEQILERGHLAPIQARTKPVGRKPGASTRPCVLVVEDEAIVALEIASVLIKAGFEIVGPARTVSQALDSINERGCDAAVLDINLGSETSEAVAVRLKGCGTPFLAVSGYSKEQHPPVFNGAAALRKPLQPEILIAELKNCVVADVWAGLS
jgi:PAS domain S-box-containing protein